MLHSSPHPAARPCQSQVQLDVVSRDPWRLRLNLLPSEPVTLRSGTQRGAPGETATATHLAYSMTFCLCTGKETSRLPRHDLQPMEVSCPASALIWEYTLKATAVLLTLRRHLAACRVRAEASSEGTSGGISDESEKK